MRTLRARHYEREKGKKKVREEESGTAGIASDKNNIKNSENFDKNKGETIANLKIDQNKVSEIRCKINKNKINNTDKINKGRIPISRPKALIIVR